MFSRKKDPELPQRPVTESALRSWLVASVARRAERDPETIDTSTSFEDFGLDSLAGFELSGRIEKVLEVRLSPALLYNYNTIDAIVGHLAERFGLERCS
jgi:acyl carrier protein